MSNLYIANTGTDGGGRGVWRVNSTDYQYQYAPGIKKAGSQPCQITNIGKRGKAENNKGLSKFNNAYVDKITKLRFLAGVGTQKPSQSFLVAYQPQWPKFVLRFGKYKQCIDT